MKDFKKYYTIPASPEELFAALTNEATIRLWSGSEAVMPSEIGAEFSMWDGDITGRILELEAGKKIVQEWFFGDQEPASIVTIKLHADKSGTSAELRHTNIPDEDFENITQGWNEAYFGSLVEFYTD